MIKSVSFAVVVSSLLVCAQQANAQSKVMTGAQIKEKMVGKTLFYSGKTRGTTKINSDGTAALSDSKFGKSKGRWWIKGNKWCRRWAKWPKAVKCVTYRDLGNGRVRMSNGYSATIK